MNSNPHRTALILALILGSIIYLVGTSVVRAQADGSVVVTATNQSYSQSLMFKLKFYNTEDETPVWLYDQQYPVPPRGTVTQSFTFSYANGTSQEARLYTPAVFGTIQGASFVTGETGTEQLIAVAQYAGNSYAYPLTCFLFDPVVLPDGAKTVWALSDSTLTGNLFREGVDKIIAQSGGGGGSGAGGGVTTNTEAHQGLGLAAEAAKPSTSSMSREADNQALAMADALEENVAFPQGAGTATGGAVEGSFWQVALPVAGGGNITLDLNPLVALPHAVEIYGWIKMIFTVIIIALFEMWVWGKFEMLAMGLSLAPQAKGNTVAGTGGQATGLLAATLLATVMVSFPAAIWAVYSGAFSVIGASPGPDIMASSTSSMVQAFWFLAEVFPIGTLIIIWAQMFIVNKAGMVVYFAAVIAIRFVVPIIILGFVFVNPKESRADTLYVHNYDAVDYFVYVQLPGTWAAVSLMVPKQSTASRDIGQGTIGGEMTVGVYTLGTYTEIYTGSLTYAPGRTYEIQIADGSAGFDVNEDAIGIGNDLKRGVEYFLYGFTLVSLWELGGMALRMFKSMRREGEGYEV